MNILGGVDTAVILTRINVGDYEAWKPMFDQDLPGARRSATGYRLFRTAEGPNEVFIQAEAVRR
jgi:hypothetical protein